MSKKPFPMMRGVAASLLIGGLLAVPAFAQTQTLAGGPASEGACKSVTRISEPVSGLRVTRSAREGEGCREQAAPLAVTNVQTETRIVVRVRTDDDRFRQLGTSPYVLGAPRPKHW